MAVFGGGPIGQVACRIAAQRGANHVILVESAPERRRFGPASRADPTMSPAQAGVQLDTSTVGVVFECSGSAAARAEALRLLTPGGVLVNVGAGPGGGFDPDTFWSRSSPSAGRSSTAPSSTAPSNCSPAETSASTTSPRRSRRSKRHCGRSRPSAPRRS
ncbi:zinc-binding dehydrogenase [Streptomyces sp. NPDC058470]|uniref:zinc-binding dehydrogenase n=1 Tax=Streptomyces sp. NPDC058470 TaxID=3346515 RepID=UPI00364CD749